LAPVSLQGLFSFFNSAFLGGRHLGSGGGHGSHHEGGRQTQSARQVQQGTLAAEEEAMGSSAANALFSSHGADLHYDHPTGLWISAALLNKAPANAGTGPAGQPGADKDHLEQSADSAALHARFGKSSLGPAGRDARAHPALVGANPLFQHGAGDPVARLDQVRPGDVLQFHEAHDPARATPAGFRAPETSVPQSRLAIVQRNLGGGRFKVVHQHNGNQLPLSEETIDLSGMNRGVVRIYRPGDR
jgi:hypothetical protein